MSRDECAAATLSDRTLHWFGDKTRDELLVEIDRIITTDKPALARIYEVLDELRAAYDEFYESGDKSRLLNAEKLVRDVRYG